MARSGGAFFGLIDLVGDKLGISPEARDKKEMNDLLTRYGLGDDSPENGPVQTEMSDRFLRQAMMNDQYGDPYAKMLVQRQQLGLEGNNSINLAATKNYLDQGNQYTTQKAIDEVNAKFPIQHTVDEAGNYVELPPSADKQEALSRIVGLDKFNSVGDIVKGGIEGTKTRQQQIWELNNTTAAQNQSNATQRDSNAANFSLAKAINLQKQQLFDQDQVTKEYESEGNINNRNKIIRDVDQFLNHPGRDTALSGVIPNLPFSPAKAADAIIKRVIAQTELAIAQQNKGQGAFSEGERQIMKEANIRLSGLASVADKLKAIKQMRHDLGFAQGSNLKVHKKLFKKDAVVDKYVPESTSKELPKGIRLKN